MVDHRLEANEAHGKPPNRKTAPDKRARFELGAKWRWSRPYRNLTALLALLLRWFLGGSFLLGFLRRLFGGFFLGRFFRSFFLGSRLLRRFLLRGGFRASTATRRGWPFPCGRVRGGYWD